MLKTFYKQENPNGEIDLHALTRVPVEILNSVGFVDLKNKTSNFSLKKLGVGIYSCFLRRIKVK